MAIASPSDATALAEVYAWMRKLRGYVGVASFTGTVNAAGVQTVNITFPAAMDEVPVVQATINGGSGFLAIARVDNITTTGARIVFMNTGTTNLAVTALPIAWEAKYRNV